MFYEGFRILDFRVVLDFYRGLEAASSEFTRFMVILQAIFGVMF